MAVDEPLGGESLARAAAALDAGDRDRAVGIFLREIAAVPRIAVAALRLVPPLWGRLRSPVRAQLADTKAIDSLGVDRYRAVDVPVLLLGGGGLSPAPVRTRLDALAAVLPRLDARVTMRTRGHGAHYSAPGAVAAIVGDFADRLFR